MGRAAGGPTDAGADEGGSVTDAMMESVGVQVQGLCVEGSWSLAPETTIDNAKPAHGVLGTALFQPPGCAGPVHTPPLRVRGVQNSTTP